MLRTLFFNNRLYSSITKLNRSLTEADPEMTTIIRGEEGRQKEGLNLIAS